jgi:hypothetical protein
VTSADAMVFCFALTMGFYFKIKAPMVILMGGGMGALLRDVKTAILHGGIRFRRIGLVRPSSVLLSGIKTRERMSTLSFCRSNIAFVDRTSLVSCYLPTSRGRVVRHPSATAAALINEQTCFSNCCLPIPVPTST